LIATDGSPCHQCDGHVYIHTSNSHLDQQIIKCDTCQKRTSIFVDSRLELFVICQNTHIIRRFDDEGSTIDQGVIFGMLGRTSGVIELAIIPDNKAATMRPIIDAHMMVVSSPTIMHHMAHCGSSITTTYATNTRSAHIHIHLPTQ
jgi:hypothetical protein